MHLAICIAESSIGRAKGGAKTCCKFESAHAQVDALPIAATLYDIWILFGLRVYPLQLAGF